MGFRGFERGGGVWVCEAIYSGTLLMEIFGAHLSACRAEGLDALESTEQAGYRIKDKSCWESVYITLKD